MEPRLPSLVPVPIAFAHRGASAHAPENTLDAFRLALRLGATGLESDVWRTADGAAVLDHDGTVRAGLRRRRIAELTRAQLPDHIPSLAEAIEACGTALHLSLDVKDPAVVDEVVGVVTEAGDDLVHRTWLCHGDLDDLVAWRGAHPDVRLVDSTRLRRVREGLERRAATLSTTGVDAINLHHTDWSGGLVALVHRFTRLAFAWDAQHVEVLRRTLRMGIDAVYSDHVDRMVDAVAAEI